MFYYSIAEWFLLFYIYSFLGWCFESGWVSLRTKHWVNRGFMRAPFLPLYGSGALILYVISGPFRDNMVLLYIVGFLGATVWEFIVGFVMEQIYRIKYWDYTRQRIQIMGQICLTSSIAWGFMNIFIVRVVHGPVERVVLALPEGVVIGLVVSLSVVLIWDFVVSLQRAIALRTVLLDMERQYQETRGKQGRKWEMVREEIADACLEIQAELTAKSEVRISKLYELVEEDV